MTTQTEALTPLIELLAQTDALFTPIRSWSNPARVAAICERREAFFRGGLPWRSGGDPAERKAKERSADELEQSGVVAFSRSNGKRIAWRLPSGTDWKLRSLTQWHGFPEMLVIMLAMQQHEVAAPGFVGDWVLASIPGDASPARLRDRCFTVEWALLPGLVRGLIESWSDAHGSVGYCLTPAGRKFLQDPQRPAIDLPEYSSEANGVYLVALREARRELRTAQPTHENCVPIPLGCGDWPCDSERPAAIPPVFTKAGNVRSAASFIRATQKTNTTAARCRKTPSSRKDK